MDREIKKHLSKGISDIDSFKKFCDLYTVLREASIYAKDTGIPSRVMSYWRINDLMPESKTDGWNKFNFIDYVWLRVIQRLRDFGLSLEAIKVVKLILLDKADINWNDETIDKLFDSGLAAIEKSALSQEIKTNLIQLMSLSEIKEEFKRQNIVFTMIGCLINKILLESEEVGVVYFASGHALPWIGEMQSNKGLGIYLKMSHIYISITEIIMEFLSDKSKEKFIKEYFPLSEREQEVLSRIRQKDLQEVVIKFPQGSGKENFEIITKKKIGLPKEQEEEVCRILRLKNYQSITIKTQGDGRLYVEKIHRKKL